MGRDWRRGERETWFFVPELSVRRKSLGEAFKQNSLSKKFSVERVKESVWENPFTTDGPVDNLT